VIHALTANTGWRRTKNHAKRPSVIKFNEISLGGASGVPFPSTE
jgi:hypothetical protein